ncbi:MAG: CRISPR-associated endonuclease Cas2 [Anaerolineae bacterium]
MFVVVAYDIAHDGRRQRVMKMLKGYGQHVQESVFECDLKAPVYREMVKRLKDLIDLKADNVRLYHLCSADVDRIETLGVGREVQLAREYLIV